MNTLASRTPLTSSLLTAAFLLSVGLADARADSDEADYQTHGIFFWTNRQIKHRDGVAEDSIEFTSRLAASAGGTLNVTVPNNRKPGSYSRPTTCLQQEDVSRHMTVQSMTLMDKRSFFERLRKRVANSPNKAVLIMVHGYDYHFDEAAYRAGQFVEDSGFDGTLILFSWPSHGEMGKEGYFKDVEQAMVSDSAFVRLLVELREELPEARTSVLAHSMGCRIVGNAIAQIVVTKRDRELPMLHQLIMAAPDIDGDLFESHFAQALVAEADRVTVYVSRTDFALQLSKSFNSDRWRLGDVSTGLPSIEGIEFIDATGANGQGGPTSLGHMYYVDSVKVMKGIAETLAGVSRP